MDKVSTIIDDWSCSMFDEQAVQIEIKVAESINQSIKK